MSAFPVSEPEFRNRSELTLSGLLVDDPIHAAPSMAVRKGAVTGLLHPQHRDRFGRQVWARSRLAAVRNLARLRSDLDVGFALRIIAGWRLQRMTGPHSSSRRPSSMFWR